MGCGGLAGAPGTALSLGRSWPRRCRAQEPRRSGLWPVLNAPVNFSVCFCGGSRLISCWLWTHDSLPFIKLFDIHDVTESSRQSVRGGVGLVWEGRRG